MIASGQVEDYDPITIASEFATLAKVPIETVTVSLVKASVKIDVSIATADEAATENLEATLSPSLATASDASSALGIAIEVDPLVQRTVTIVQLAAPPSAPPPDSSNNDAVIIGASVGGAVGLLVILAGIGVTYFVLIKRQSTPKEVQASQVQLSMDFNQSSTTAAIQHQMPEDAKMEPAVDKI